MNKSKAKKKDINFASFEEKLPNVAYNLFREWTKNAIIEYPNLDFTIKDESVLVDDFRKCLNSSFVSLFENSKYKTGIFLPQWDYGYILGFIEGNLGKHWYHEYIQKHEEDYRIFISFKTLTSYLDFDKVLEARIDTLYEHLLNENSNLANLKTEVVKKDIDFSDEMKIIKTDEIGKIRAILENLTIKYVLKLAKQDSKEYLENLSQYINYQQFTNIIKDNKL